jgi:hypothetical protein
VSSDFPHSFLLKYSFSANSFVCFKILVPRAAKQRSVLRDGFFAFTIDYSVLLKHSFY